MPSYLDLALLGIVVVSALLSMVRGFTREVLAIASWAAAAVAAYLLYPRVMPYLEPYIAKDTVRMIASIAIVFFVTLVLVSIITVKLSDAILDSKVGALDRTLGFVFGAARGFLLGVVAFLFFNWLVPPKSQPEWVATAKSKPLLQAGMVDRRIVCTKRADRPSKSEPAARGEEHYVYRRHGKPCFLCGDKILRRDLVGRTLYWCARDQHTSKEETATAYEEGVSLRASREQAKPGGKVRKRAGALLSEQV